MELSLSERLLCWYQEHRRRLPWRAQGDPYAVWVAEVMLQQTRVETVIPYFERWMERFPTVFALAQASEEEVLRLWEGLGYYQRARNLWRAAQQIVEHYHGALPRERKSLQQLPGIGSYTAAAIASFAFGLDEVAIDGNLKRVLARLFDLAIPLNGTKAHKTLEAVARQHLPSGRSADYNQALMDLGATICLPQNPQCEKCPLESFCLARARGTVHLRPLPLPKQALPRRVQVSALIRRAESVLLTRRPAKSLLGGLWEFPAIFIEAEEAIEIASSIFLESLGLRLQLRAKIGELAHAYTHFRLQVEVWECELLAEPPEGLEWVPLDCLAERPMGKVARQIARGLIAQQASDQNRL